MRLRDAEKKLFKAEKEDIRDVLRVDVPMVVDAAYDVNFLHSENLSDLEEGIRNAKRVGDFAWYAIAVSLAKIIDGGLYAQSGLMQSEYKAQLQERLGIDKRRISEFLQAGRFLIQHGQKLLNLGWRPEGMEAKIKLANNAKKVIKNESKLLDAIMTKSLDDLRQIIRSKKKPADKRSKLSLVDGALMLDGHKIMTIAPDLPDDLKQDLERFMVTLADSRAKHGHIACFVVDTRRQAQNAPRVFYDFIRGKFKRA